MKTTAKLDTKGVYRFGVPGFNAPLKKNQPLITPRDYAKDFLFSEQHPMIISNCGASDLENVRDDVKGSGIVLEKGGPLFLSLVYAYRKVQINDIHKIFIAYEVHEYWKDSANKDYVFWKLRFPYDRTSFNHALNRLVAIGVLSFKKRGQKNIQYFLSDGFIKQGGFDWFFSSSNLKPQGIFYGIPGICHNSIGLVPNEKFTDVMKGYCL